MTSELTVIVLFKLKHELLIVKWRFLRGIIEIHLVFNFTNNLISCILDLFYNFRGIISDSLQEEAQTPSDRVNSLVEPSWFLKIFADLDSFVINLNIILVGLQSSKWSGSALMMTALAETQEKGRAHFN